MPLEVLHLALVFLGFFARAERSKIPAPAGLGVFLFRVQAVAACVQFSNHATANYLEEGLAPP